LRSLSLIQTEIKWPNDVLVNGKKICGVLAEAFWEGGELSAVVLGIGINIAANGIPETKNMAVPATSVESEMDISVDRIELLRKIVKEILDLRFIYFRMLLGVIHIQSVRMMQHFH